MNVEAVIKKAESDEGLTVKEIKVYRKMLSDAKLGKYDIILVRDFSRISRSVFTLLKVKKALENMGIKIYDCGYAAQAR